MGTPKRYNSIPSPLHKRENTLANRPEIVIFKLLSFGSTGTEKRITEDVEIGTVLVMCPIDQKKLLFCAYKGMNVGNILISQQPQQP